MSSLDTRLEHASWLETASSIRHFLAHFKAQLIEDSQHFLASSGAKLKFVGKASSLRKRLPLLPIISA